MKIIQLQPWRDMLLALTDEGEIYRLILNKDNDPLFAFLIFPGIPREV